MEVRMKKIDGDNLPPDLDYLDEETFLDSLDDDPRKNIDIILDSINEFKKEVYKLDKEIEIGQYLKGYFCRLKDFDHRFSQEEKALISTSFAKILKEHPVKPISEELYNAIIKMTNNK